MHKFLLHQATFPSLDKTFLGSSKNKLFLTKKCIICPLSLTIFRRVLWLELLARSMTMHDSTVQIGQSVLQPTSRRPICKLLIVQYRMYAMGLVADGCKTQDPQSCMDTFRLRIAIVVFLVHPSWSITFLCFFQNQ